MTIPPIIIPFAADSVAPSQVRMEDDRAVSYRLPSIAVESGRALRLNSGGLRFGDPPPLKDLPTTPDQLAFLRDHFRHLCGIWEKHARLFIDRYFDFIAAETATHRDQMAEMLRPFGTLYEPEHWAFSALRPLPRAHLTAPEMPGQMPPASLVRTEIAFWTADGAVAVEIVGGSTRGTAEAQRRDRLENAGIRIIEFPRDILAAGGDRFRDRLPDDFLRFWRGEALPAGPFRAGETPMELPPGEPA